MRFGILDKHMRFGIVVCPKCRKAKAADLLCKTTRCIRCGYTIYLDKVRVIYKTDSLQKLRQAIAKVNTKISKKNPKDIN